MPTTRRNLEFEREMTRAASRTVADPETLIMHAEARSMRAQDYVGDMMQIRLDRDERKYAREEAADLRNYIVWWLQRNPEHEDVDDMTAALRHTAILYQLLQDED